MDLSGATSAGSSRRMAISHQMTVRRRPRALYVVLLVLAAFTFAYEVRLAYQQFPGLFGYRDAPGRPFFLETHGTDPIQISFVEANARQAGLKNGDTLLTINGRPVVGAADFGEAMAAARAGDVMRVTVRREGESGDRSAAIKLGYRASGRSAVWYALAILNVIVVPLLCLTLGFWVAFVRPRDRLAWLLLGFLSTYAVFFNADAEAWGPVVRDLAVFYRMGVEAAFPAVVMLFGLLFPEPFPRTGRSRWWYHVAWVLLVPSLIIGILESIDDVVTVESRAAAIGLDRFLGALGQFPLLLSFACYLMFFAALIIKWRMETGRDSKRRLSLVLWGTALGMGPLLIMDAVSNLKNQALEVLFPWWAFVPAYMLLVLVPVTFAYVIVVQRAMDVRLVVRQGLRYALARRGVLVLQVVLSAALFILVAALVTSHSTRPIVTVAVLGAGLWAIFLLHGLTQRLATWIDRRFFREAYDAERILSDLGDQVRTIVETQPLLETVTGRIAESLHVPRVAVLLNGGAPYLAAYAVGYGGVPNVSFPANAATVERLKKEREPARVYFRDPNSWIYRDPGMTDEERAKLAELESELLLPLAVKDRLIGFMSLAPKLSEQPYTGSDLRLLKSVAAQTGLALEVARLTTVVGEEIAHRERLNRELEIAREVQERLFPQELPVIPGLDYTGRCRPAREVGGDYYDFLELPEGKFGIAIGDVSGKGIGAALMMAALEASLRGQASLTGGDLAELISRVNRLVYEASSVNRYATFFYAQLDPKSLRLTYVNAGHNPPFVLRRLNAGWEIRRLETGGPVVGLLRVAPYQQASFALERGDLLVCFTDGVSEAMNPLDEEWGEDHLIAAAQACDGLDAADMVTRIIAAADRFAGGAPQHDDMTLVILRVLEESATAREV
jgi:sigma-B regulation protein RsbU (phosphoserine phosphatase)